MIIPHPILNSKINCTDIDFIAEREGYTKFLPYTFIRHLAYSFSYHLVNLDPNECIQVYNPYTIEFKKIINMIHYDEVNTMNAIKFAIRVLKSIDRKTNLRKLETAALTGTSFTILEESNYQNYKCDLIEFSSEQLDALNIKDDDNLETIKLSDEILQILQFYDGLNLLKQTVDTKYDVVKQQIRSFGDFFKVRKYKFALPTFNVDLGMKKLQITKVDDSDVYTSEVVIAIDCSASMGYITNARSLIRSVLLYYIGQLDKVKNLTVTLVFITGKISMIEKFTKAKDLTIAFHKLYEFGVPTFSSHTMFTELNTMYPGKSIIFVTDGTMQLKKSIKLKFQLYSIVLNHNEILKQMSLLSGGQFIILK